MASSGSKDVSSSLSSLSIDPSKGTSTPKTAAPKSKPKKKVVADSWDDEDSSSSEDDTPATPATSTPAAPPPTPMSPSYPVPGGVSWPTSPRESPREGSASEPRRPEKTDAVARRMIAAGLGLKAPKQTEEQKAYQRSVREQEKRKRELEREAEQKRKEDVEKAKAAVWDD